MWDLDWFVVGEWVGFFSCGISVWFLGDCLVCLGWFVPLTLALCVSRLGC